MSRLADKILTHGIAAHAEVEATLREVNFAERHGWVPGWGGRDPDEDRATHEEMRQFCRHCQVIVSGVTRGPVVVLDAAADHALTLAREGKEVEYPNVAPPWPSAFYEYRSKLLAGEAVGVLVQHVPIDTFAELPLGNPFREMVDRPGAHWFLAMAMLLGAPTDRGASYIADLAAVVSKEGEQIGALRIRERPGIGPEDGEDESLRGHETAGIAAALLLPVWFGVSLLHCKNVTLDTVAPPPKLVRKHERRGTRPPVRYHVLEVGPMVTAAPAKRATDPAAAERVARALHLVRGHFATYDAARPLFGRVTGTFWRPMHARGTVTEGVVQKDYRLRRGAAETAERSAP